MRNFPEKTLLCVGNYDRNTGYAWNTIRSVWAAVAEELAHYDIRTLVVHRQNTKSKNDLLNHPYNVISV